MHQAIFFVGARPLRSGVALLLVVLLLLPLFSPVAAVRAQSGNVGYRDFSFPTGLGGATRGPTGEKPESKLWWVDGVWYGSLWSRPANAYTIHRFNLGSQSWADTGVKIDDRLGSKADALWDGSRLYIVSHLYIENAAAPAPAGERGELYRYTYNTTSRTFALDSGFPVEVNRGKTETLVIDKDSSGTLWVTYVESNKVMVNHSLNGDDRQWGTPFVLPASGMETVHKDDISSLITYNNHVGVMWSRQNSTPNTMYFSVHPVGTSDTTWTRVRSFSLGADDHINLKSLQSDNAGNIFAVIKTNDDSRLIVVLVCKNNVNRCKNESDWTPYTVYNANSGSATRPILMIDETNRHLYIFVRSEPTGTTRGGIYYKRANIDNISFDPNVIGTAFINNPTDFQVDDPTSTKQNVTAASGLLVLASDRHSLYYLHNYIALGGTPPSPPTISGFSPTSGPAGTEVMVTGTNFTGANAVTFNNTAAASFIVDSSTSLRVSVPAGATTGPIRVSTTAGTATSSTNFTVEATPPQTYTLTVSTQGSGQVTLNPPGGVYDAGTVVSLAAAPAEGWVFSGWQGDLSGTTNPATLTMNGNKAVTAVFSEPSSGGGTIVYEGTVTGTALQASSVSTPNTVGGSGLFLAAISTRNSMTVSSVSGLGLTWTRVLRQCAGRNISMADVWMAQGAPAANGAVTAQFGASFKSAVIAVSRYSGASTTQPIGAVIGGNTRGLSGACTGGVDSASYSFSLTTGTPGAVVYSAVSMRNRAHTPGVGYTERGEIFAGSGGDMTSIAVQDKTVASPASTAVNGTFSGSVDWSMVGLEIVPGGGTPPPPPPPPDPTPTITGFSPTSGPAGTEVTVTGTNFTGTTAVSFNNTAATFTVDSATQVRAAVPAGATTGRIRVTTPDGTATSSTDFTVTIPPSPPTITGFSPASGPAGTEVTVTGTNFTGATSVTFNTTAATFTIDSATQIRANVPAGAATGPIQVSTTAGTATSSMDFTVEATPPQTYTLTVSTQGSGQVTLNPPGGLYDAGTVVSLAAAPAEGWVFSGWQGDLSGTTNPANLTMNGNKAVTALFSEQTGGGGTVTYQETVTGTALLASEVTSADIGGAGANHLYLAAVSTRNPMTVSSVSGLGLTWTRVLRQCAGRNATMVDVWMAQGAPAANGAVTAQFGAAFKSAVITVSRYSGASTTQPIGAVIGGNTLGLNGACTGGVDTGSYSFTLTTGTPGAVVYSAASMRNRTHTPGAGYTERGEVFAGSGGDVSSLAVQDQTVASPASTAVNGAFSGTADWSLVGLEILPGD